MVVVMRMAKHFASNPRSSIAVCLTEWPPNMCRDKYVASLQEWENALFTGSLNQWNVEDRIADDIIDEVLEVRTNGETKDPQRTHNGQDNRENFQLCRLYHEQFRPFLDWI